jgi:hypothetical protein
MAFGVVLVGCSSSTTSETDVGAKDSATSAEVSADSTATDTAVTDTGEEAIAMPYGAPPMDGLLV